MRVRGGRSAARTAPRSRQRGPCRRTARLTRRTPRTPFGVVEWPQSSAGPGGVLPRGGHTEPMVAVDDIEARLGELAVPTRAAQEKRYLKSDLRHLGVTLPAVRKNTDAAATGLDREATLTLVDELWQAPVHERRTAAIENM